MSTAARTDLGPTRTDLGPTRTDLAPPWTDLAPTRSDPLAATASQVVGGPLGRHVVPGRRGWRPVAAVLIAASTLLIGLGVLERAPCIRFGWTTPDQFWHACYSDLPIVYQSSGLASGVEPYLKGVGRPPHFLDQPVVSGAVMWLVSLAVPGGSALDRQRWYFGIWAVLITLAVAVVVLATVRSAPRRPWTAAQVAFSPILVTASLVSGDVLGVALTSLGLWAWSRRKVPLAGVLLGLAVATRSYPLVVLLAIGLVALRSGQLRAYAVLAGSSVVTFAAVTLPLVLTGAGQGVLSTYRTWWDAPAGYGSPWQLADLARQMLTAYRQYLANSQLPRTGLATLSLAPLTPAGATALALLGWVVALLAGALLALGTARRPGVAEVAFVMLAIVVLTGKTLPVQAALWLLPLLALVGVRWRDQLLWAGTELAYFVAVWLYIAGLSKPDRGLPGGWFAAFLVLRLGVLVYLVCRVVGIARRRTAVGADEADGAEGADPAGDSDELAGPFAGAADRVVVRFE